MTDIIRHRGPDDEGYILLGDKNSEIECFGAIDTPGEVFKSRYHYSPVGQLSDNYPDVFLAFGHRRLSILDLSPSGHQPMSYSDGRYWIVYNGEIYNYIEIRQQLLELGHTFVSNSDTEVILAAYHQWGIDCQNRFNGMWAFVIYDSHDQVIFMSRDRFGIKPLYYWYAPDGSFCFGSEIKQFTVFDSWRATLNSARASDYLYYSLTDHTHETMFKGVYQVQPGHSFHGGLEQVMSFQKTGIMEASQWYKPDLSPFNETFRDAKTAFLDYFKSSIKLHLRADVPVGSALSGGLDSSAIVSYIKILLDKDNKSELQKTFSSCSHDHRFDERIWMDEVVGETGIDAHFIYPRGEDVFKLTERLIWHMDEPYASQSVFLGYHVFEEARKNGVKVLLNGQGADEYLSGYAEFRLLRQAELIKRFKWLSAYREINSFAELATVFKNILASLIPNFLKYRLAYLNQSHRKIDKVVDWRKLVSQKAHPYQLNRYQKNSAQSISWYQTIFDPLPKYLRWEDRNSMAHSVEARVPFLDYRLVEFARRLPLDYLDGPDETKKILIHALKGILPEKIRNRKDKKGFITPEQIWFTEDYFDEFLRMFRNSVPYTHGIIRPENGEKYLTEMKNGKIPFDYTYWRFILFCIWMKTFNVQTD